MLDDPGVHALVGSHKGHSGDYLEHGRGEPGQVDAQPAQDEGSQPTASVTPNPEPVGACSESLFVRPGFIHFETSDSAMPMAYATLLP